MEKEQKRKYKMKSAEHTENRRMQRKATKEKSRRMGSRIRNGKYSNNEDNNSIGLFIGWSGTKNKVSLRLAPRIRKQHVSLALSKGHNYPYLWHMTLSKAFMATYSATLCLPWRLTD